MASDYRFAPHLVVRTLGTFLALVGLMVLVLALLVAALDWPRLVLTVGVVVAVVAVVGIALLRTRLVALVRFDEAGFRIRLLRGAGVTQGRWRDVEDAVAMTVRGHESVVLRHRDGRTTTIPVDVLDTTPAAFLADLRAHLDAGHGYRRLR